MNAHKLAVAFSRLLCEELTPEEMDQVCERNAADQNPNICHSHDFCDANQVMLDALELNGIAYDTQVQDQTAMISAAWEIAKEHEFHEESIRNSENLFDQ